MGTGKLHPRKLLHTFSQRIAPRKISRENITPRKGVPRKLSLKKLPPVKYPPLVNKSNAIENKPHKKMSTWKIVF